VPSNTIKMWILPPFNLKLKTLEWGKIISWLMCQESRDDESSWWSEVGVLDPPTRSIGASAMGEQGIGNPDPLEPRVPPKSWSKRGQPGFIE
jgi:hypothetical protein